MYKNNKKYLNLIIIINNKKSDILNKVGFIVELGLYLSLNNIININYIKRKYMNMIYLIIKLNIFSSKKIKILYKSYQKIILLFINKEISLKAL
jgi:hypothetical protein